MSDQEREYGQDDFRSATAEVQAAEAELAAAQARLDAARARARAAAQQTGQEASSSYTASSQPFGSAPHQEAESQSGAQFGSHVGTQPGPQYPGAQPGTQQTGQQPGYYTTYRAPYYGQPSQGTYQTYQGSYSNSYPNNYQDPYRQNPQSQNQSFQGYTAFSTKDHVAAGLLAIFIGALGIHKFYLGYNSTGFIMLAITVLGGLLTLGLAASVMVVIALIEGIIYLTKSQTDFEQIYVLNKREWF